jgi:primosomal protein N' (replication factor Y)
VETFHTYNYFVQVILPLALPKTYTYAVPVHLEELIQTGVRVEVQFGKQKLYTAIVHAITQQAPVEYVPKAILSVVDEQPIVTQSQLDFWQWIASYYMCTLGDVMQAALPAFFKLDSETFFVKNPDNESDILDLTDDEYMIAEALNHQEQISLKDIFDILQKKTVSKPVKSLLSKRIMYVKETLHEKYTPKTEMFVVLSPQYTVNGLPIKDVFDIVSKYPNQENLLLAYIELSKKNNSVRRAELLKKAGVTGEVLKSLIKKEIFVTEEKIVDRISVKEMEELSHYELSAEQNDTLVDIKKHYEEKEVVLLHGITSSGKTLLYIDLIKEQIAQGKQVLYLLPEIALTAQLVQRLEKILGNIAVYHSKFNNAERVEIWNKVLKNETKIILGARSSVFLPFQDLGLVIIDEEHDSSYKQFDPAPRYQCRDAAIYLARQFSAQSAAGFRHAEHRKLCQRTCRKIRTGETHNALRRSTNTGNPVCQPDGSQQEKRNYFRHYLYSAR